MMLHPARLPKTAGFTLPELLAVLAIIGLLAVVAIPIFSSQTQQADRATAIADGRAWASAVSSELNGYTNFGTAPADTASAIVLGPVADGTATVTITMANPTPATPTSRSFDVAVSGTSTIVASGMSGSQWCFASSAGGQVAVFNERGYQPSATSCDRTGAVGTGPVAAGPLAITYPVTAFTSGSDNMVLSPTTTNASGPLTYSVQGTLPAGVTFNPSTGAFTGPQASAWNWRSSQLSSGSAHACALTTAGGVRCWGWNGVGGLGDGTTTTRITPVDVVGLTSGVVQVSAGHSHTCALTTGGGVKCWGQNSGGQLGDGTLVSKSSPVDVVGLTSGVARVFAGERHTCAITTAGGAKCWGFNDRGMLGDGTTTTRTTPVDVVGLTSGVTQISPLEKHTCAVTTAGGAKCWGQNTDGQLGDGTTQLRLTPVDVVGLTSGVASITVGSVHSCALTTGGGVKCWGRGTSGRLGEGASLNRSSPVDVVGLTSGVVQLAAGQEYTCAVTSGGGARCWGLNSSGQLGDGTTTLRSTPVSVTGMTSGTALVASGGYAHTCALTVTGGVLCWGNNGSGRLGIGSLTPATSLVPASVSGAAPQPGFPASVTVEVSDGSRTASTTIVLGLQ